MMVNITGLHGLGRIVSLTCQTTMMYLMDAIFFQADRNLLKLYDNTIQLAIFLATGVLYSSQGSFRSVLLQLL